MKVGFILKDIKVGEKTTVGEVNIQVQYTAGELIGEYELLKRAVKELPEVVADLGNGAMAFEEMDQEMSKYVTTKINPESTEDIKVSAIMKVVSAIKNIRSRYTTAPTCESGDKEEVNKAV